MSVCDRIEARSMALAALPALDPERTAAESHACSCARCARALRDGAQLVAMVSAELRPAPALEVFARAEQAVLHEWDREFLRPDLRGLVRHRSPPCARSRQLGNGRSSGVAGGPPLRTCTGAKADPADRVRVVPRSCADRRLRRRRGFRRLRADLPRPGADLCADALCALHHDGRAAARVRGGPRGPGGGSGAGGASRPPSFLPGPRRAAPPAYVPFRRRGHSGCGGRTIADSTRSLTSDA